MLDPELVLPSRRVVEELAAIGPDDEVLMAAAAVNVTGPTGTDVEASLAGRSGIALDGSVHDYGVAKLPSGLAVTSPVDGTAQGTVVLDHAMDGLGALDEPIENRRATAVEGGTDADRLRELLADGTEAPSTSTPS